MRTYLYKVMYDAGTAPCVDGGILSLAICKPKIRATAQPGDWIFGFGAKSRLGERLIYIAQVTQVFRNGEYYRWRESARRKDQIYDWVGSKLIQKRTTVHGPEHCRKDIGLPPAYPGAVVLLSRNFRYFGRSTASEFTQTFAALSRYVSSIKQGHRVNFPRDVATELQLLANAIWAAHPHSKVIGRPSDAVGCDS